MNDAQRIMSVVLGAVFDDHDQLLLTRREAPHNKIVHNKWQLPGGGIEFGEKPEETLFRELAEETGLNMHSASIASQVQVTTATWFAKPEGHSIDTHVLLLWYVVRVPTNTPIILNQESNAWGWHTKQTALQQDLLPAVADIINTAYSML